MVPAGAADTVLTSCSANYYQPRTCDAWFDVPAGVHPAIFRFTPPGPFVVGGQAIGFTGTLSVGIGTGPGGVHPCPDNDYGGCNVGIDYRAGQPYQYRVTGVNGAVPTTSSEVPLAHLAGGAFHFTASCQTTLTDVYVPTAWCGQASDMPGNGTFENAWRTYYPRSGYLAVQIAITG